MKKNRIIMNMKDNKRLLFTKSVNEKISNLEQEIAALYPSLKGQQDLEVIRSSIREINLRQSSIDGLKDSLNETRRPCMEVYHIVN